MKNLYFVISFFLAINCGIDCWKYQTKCTRKHHGQGETNAQNEKKISQYSSIAEDFEREVNLDLDYQSNSAQVHDDSKIMRLKCANLNDFLFIGLTQYGVSSASSSNSQTCEINKNDCLVSVDYLSNECNGLNTCDIQLDSQFLHTCKNHSDYLSVAYECIQGTKRLDICSNDETYMIDDSSDDKQSDLTNKFSSFYLSSPNYPNEYSNNLNNCSCKMEYVKLETSDSTESDIIDSDVINLAFSSYEFDLEEGDSSDNTQCSKDYLNIETDTNRTQLCGQYKEFKEFYSRSKSFSINFNSDDVISRRGFLFKISPIAESICPHGSFRFGSQKCIKYFADTPLDTEKLNWFDAQQSCQSLNGRLLVIDNFVDNIKLNALLRSRSESSIYWANITMTTGSDSNNFLNIKKPSLNEYQPLNRCLTKRLNYWQEESTCIHNKYSYICEFDPVKTRKPASNQNQTNRLIRVACGSSAAIFSDSQNDRSRMNPVKSTPKVSVTTTTTTTTKQILVSEILPIMYGFKDNTIKNNYQDDLLDEYPEYSSQASVPTTPIYNPTTKTGSLLNMINNDIALIVAIVSGVSIVIIAINLFCIWNYYNKKLKGYFQTAKIDNNTLENNYHRTSTLMKTGSTSTTTGNRTMSSTVDSYMKVPVYEICYLNGQLNKIANLQQQMCESSSLSSDSDSSASSTTKMINNHQLIPNEQKSFLTQQQQQQHHYYETLTKNINQAHLWGNTYAEYQVYDLSNQNPNNLKQFESIVVMPTSSTPTMNSAVVLLANQSQEGQQQHQEQNYSSVVYGDLSPSSTISNQPLITFVAGSPSAL